MIHHYITSNQHWAVSHNGYGNVLLQLSDNSDQVRLSLSPVQAQELLIELQAMIKVSQKDNELEFRILLPRNSLACAMTIAEDNGSSDFYVCELEPVLWTTNMNNAMHFISLNEVIYVIEELKKLGFTALYFDRTQSE